MTTKLRPRYARNRADNLRGFNIFLGYAYDLDVYANDTENDVHSGKYLIVCTKEEARRVFINNEMLRGNSYPAVPEHLYNWDILTQDTDGNLFNLINIEGDVETTAAHLVEIYNLVAQHKADYTPFVKPANVIRSV